MPVKYELTEDHPHEDFKKGDVLYDFTGSDYGCADDDTRITGVEHIAVTANATGGTPFMTAPKRILKEIA